MFKINTGLILFGGKIPVPGKLYFYLIIIKKYY